MKLRVITKEREILNIDVKHVILPGEMGEMDILRGHTRIISLLQSGKINYFSTGGESNISIEGGCAEVIDDRVTALVTLPALVEELSR